MQYADVQQAIGEHIPTFAAGPDAWICLESLDEWRRLAAICRLDWKELRPLLEPGEGGWVLRAEAHAA